MEAKQFKCISVTLPSTLSNPSATCSDDIEAARDVIVAETTQGRDVIIVAHSYGGMVGNSAMKGLARPKQNTFTATKDPSGHVIGLVLIASFFTQTGVGFMEGFGGKPPPSWTMDSKSGFVIISDDLRDLFYHDLPEEEGNYWVSKFAKQSLKAFVEGGEHAYAGWQDVPVWYLETSQDHAFPVQAQTHLVQMAKDDGGDVTSRAIESSHSPMLSKPEEIVDFLLDAVTAMVG